MKWWGAGVNIWLEVRGGLVILSQVSRFNESRDFPFKQLAFP
jgi:hypothetical protein